jgi:hypothetical protein
MFIGKKYQEKLLNVKIGENLKLKCNITSVQFAL